MRCVLVASVFACMLAAPHVGAAQEIQLSGPLSTEPADARVLPRDESERLLQLGLMGGALSRLPIGPGDGHDATSVPFVGAEVRLSFPWPYPGGGDLSHGVAASFDYGQGRAPTIAVRDERTALGDVSYFMAWPLRNYGPYSIVVAGRTRFAGGLIGAEVAIQLMEPALRVGISADAQRPLATRGCARHVDADERRCTRRLDVRALVPREVTHAASAASLAGSPERSSARLTVRRRSAPARWKWMEARTWTRPSASRRDADSMALPAAAAPRLRSPPLRPTSSSARPSRGRPP